ncbi:hypothetical protein AAFF_G00113730 [Aldrovandia affinis]|uniref:Uncharacterized protein n=1 Tax=Aldrovandia affinis TaxID=143900 RepID=A0AAD7RT47_9TELE|nr:hypothetical protein AAFF_G00113730 [Aldrovandia affinis]
MPREPRFRQERISSSSAQPFPDTLSDTPTLGVSQRVFRSQMKHDAGPAGSSLVYPVGEAPLSHYEMTSWAKATALPFVNASLSACQASVSGGTQSDGNRDGGGGTTPRSTPTANVTPNGGLDGEDICAR